MRNNDHLDPKTAQELAELEAALAGSPNADSALAMLVRDVQAERPAADPAFLAHLGADVEAGFAKHSTKRRLRLPSLRVALPAVAVLATGAIAVVLATSETPTGPGTELAQTQSAVDKAAGPAGDGTGRGSAGAPAPVAPLAEVNPTAGDDTSKVRQVERSASLTLAASSGDVQETTDRIVQTTGRLGGFVAQSSISVQDGRGTAQLRLRVPSDRLDEAMATLAKLGKVRAMDQAEQDITGSFSASNAALEDAKAERLGLLSALRKAKDSAQISRLKLRLRENAVRISAAESALNSVRSRAARATIDVSVVAGDKGASQAQEQGFGVGVALDAALRVLSASAGVLILILAGAIPLLGVTLVGLGAMRAARRRSREQALEQSANSEDR